MFYLGTHVVSWLAKTDVPLFISRRRLTHRKTLPQAQGPWALDSGGFTELNLYGHWQTTAREYVADVRRFENEIGNLAWVAPQDWMCEPQVLAKTRGSVEVHQLMTCENFMRLRDELGLLVIPVLQGWTLDDYLFHADMYYEEHGIDLREETIVGLGSVCRRQNMAEAGLIVRRLAAEGIRLHGFGVKLTGIRSFGDALASADSMAWSYNARRSHPLADCTHKSCANCLKWALRWHDQVQLSIGQQRLEVAA